MAGGSGTRFWPLSREKLPKQFLKLFNDKSMLRLTYERLLSFIENKDIFIVTTKSQVALINEHIPELKETQIIIEPCGMNTAPCIALSSIYLKSLYDIEEKVLVLPADHYIADEKAFVKYMRVAMNESYSQKLLTFGIVPTYPATGYGYIEAGDEFLPAMFHVKHFKEKPDIELATQFLSKGNFYWNSGMFCWTIQTILESFKKYYQEILNIANEVSKETCPLKQKGIYQTIPKLPIDIAILEKADNVIVMLVDFAWSDVGNWYSLSELMPKDEARNYKMGNGCLMSSEGNSVFSDKFIALVGVSDLLVVDTNDALLIINKDKAEQVKKVVDYLKENRPDML
jgi:mannose-1-phosphate guanylyltransferase